MAKDDRWFIQQSYSLLWRYAVGMGGGDQAKARAMLLQIAQVLRREWPAFPRHNPGYDVHEWGWREVHRAGCDWVCHHLGPGPNPPPAATILEERLLRLPPQDRSLMVLHFCLGDHSLPRAELAVIVPHFGRLPSDEARCQHIARLLCRLKGGAGEEYQEEDYDTHH